MKITLVRHGHSTGNSAETVTGLNSDPLTQLGVSQGKLLAGFFANASQFDAVYSSPAKRALETASLAGFTAPLTDERLCETDGGEWACKTKADFEKAFPGFYAPLDMERAYPGGESHMAMAARVESFLRELAEHPISNGIIFTHLGPINIILHRLVGVNLSRFPFFGVRNCGVIELDFRDKAHELTLHRLTML